MPHWDFCKEPHLPTLALTALLNLLPSEKLTPGLPRAPGLHIARLCGAKVLELKRFWTFDPWALEELKSQITLTLTLSWPACFYRYFVDQCFLNSFRPTDLFYCLSGDHFTTSYFLTQFYHLFSKFSNLIIYIVSVYLKTSFFLFIFIMLCICFLFYIVLNLHNDEKFYWSFIISSLISAFFSDFPFLLSLHAFFSFFLGSWVECLVCFYFFFINTSIRNYRFLSFHCIW